MSVPALISCSAILTCPAGVAATVATHWITTIGMATVTALATLQPIGAILTTINTFRYIFKTPHKATMRQAGLFAAQLKDRLTWQDSSQRAPLHPGEHVQVPSIGSHAAPLAHTHVWLQARPHAPLEQKREQSIPCQPGVRESRYVYKEKSIVETATYYVSYNLIYKIPNLRNSKNQNHGTLQWISTYSSNL